MGITKDVSVNVGGDLADLIARVRLAAKRDDDGAVQAAQFLRVGESLYMVTGITATRGAVNGETVLTLTRLAGEDGPPVALISSRSPAPCSVARATDAEVIAAASAASAGIAPVHLNPPAPRPVRAAAAALRPVDFDAPCAAPVTGRCGTRGQRFEPLDTLETVSVLGATEAAPEWAAAVDATVEPAPVEPVTETEAPRTASEFLAAHGIEGTDLTLVWEATAPVPVTDPATETEPAPVTETETPAPKGKRSRKG
jgi:hypothetical protein